MKTGLLIPHMGRPKHREIKYLTQRSSYQLEADL